MLFRAQITIHWSLPPWTDSWKTYLTNQWTLANTQATKLPRFRWSAISINSLIIRVQHLALGIWRTYNEPHGAWLSTSELFNVVRLIIKVCIISKVMLVRFFCTICNMVHMVHMQKFTLSSLQTHYSKKHNLELQSHKHKYDTIFTICSYLDKSSHPFSIYREIRFLVLLTRVLIHISIFGDMLL